MSRLAVIFIHAFLDFFRHRYAYAPLGYKYSKKARAYLRDRVIIILQITRVENVMSVQKKDGFTILELLVVIMLIGILVTIVLFLNS
jgi:prepilin-type N-terminal cleavage/methylation domain-containing protein